MIEDYYGTEIEVSPCMASPGPMVDIDRRFSAAKRQPAATERRPGEVDDFDRLTPEQACKLAIDLINAAQEIDPTGMHDALLHKFAEMTREGRL